MKETRRWEEVGRLNPEQDEDKIEEAKKTAILPMPEALVMMLYHACLRPSSFVYDSK